MLRSTALISCLLLAAEGYATTVYKSVDVDGVVSYTDTPPVQRTFETVDIATPLPSSSPAEVQARQTRMRAATDAMASARKAREQASQSSRAKPRRVVPAKHQPEPLVYAYPYYRERHHLQRPPLSNRPVDQIDPPPERRRLPTVPLIPR